MSFTTESPWDSSDVESPYYCRTPPALNSSPNWDCFFDLGDNFDPKSSLELLQKPMPYHNYEAEDEWLVEYRRLQEVHSRAPVPAVSSAALEPPRHAQHTFAAADAHDTGDIGPRQPGRRRSPPSPYHFRGAPPIRGEGSARVRDETNDAAPASARFSFWADGQGFGSPSPMIYTSALYGWNPTPAYDNQHASSPPGVERAMRDLKEMEQGLQADTKRRISQVEESRPGG